MSQFFIFVRKEFIQMFRDVRTLMILFGLPITLVVLLGFALTNEIKDARIVVCDYAHDTYSRQIVQLLAANPNFIVQESLMSHEEIDRAFRSGRVKLAVVFPAGFRDQLLHTRRAELQIVADASDPNTADLLTGYVESVVRGYASSLQSERAPTAPPLIDLNVRALYNPELRSAVNFVPGVIAFVLMMISVLMTSVSIVREKEFGTMEVLLASPIRPLYIILAKAVPYFALSLVDLVSILLLSAFVLDVPIEGSLFLLFGVSMLYILLALSLGLMISTLVESQVAAMLSSGMALMAPTMIFSGLMFPIESMPVVLQWVSTLMPARWYIAAMRKIMIQGASLVHVETEILALTLMTSVLILVSLYKFKTRLE